MKAIGTRLALRAGSLALKFALTIVVTRKLGFDAVAAYGFAIAASVVASKVLGLGFSTELNRRLSEGEPSHAIGVAKRLFAVYVAVYATLCLPLAVPGLAHGLLRFTALPHLSLWLVALVACTEHAALEVNTYLYSLQRVSAATWLLFTRTGAWAALAIVALMANGMGSVDALFYLWAGTNIVTVAAGWIVIGRIAHESRERFQPCTPAGGLAKVWVDGLPFFAALLLLSVLQYLERFIAADTLTPGELGRYVFTWSVANAIQTAAAATIAFAAAPRLVRAAALGKGAFRRELFASAGASLALSAVAAAAILALRLPLFHLAHESADTWQITELGVLLLSFVLRAGADILWAAAIALRAGSYVAAGMAALTLACLPMAITFIHRFGTLGAAFAHLTASILIFALLAWAISTRLSSFKPITREIADAA